MTKSTYPAVMNILYLLLLSSTFFLGPVRAHAIPPLPQVESVTAHEPDADPDKESSERNHHIAGMFLIAIGLAAICSQQDSMGWLRWFMPVFFIAAGLFLAAWSDDEIWPRGDLSWLWLLHHDAEARQHKLYALLLLVVGGIELIQISARRGRRWLAFIVPGLAVLGALSLFAHHHSAPVANGNATHTLTEAAAMHRQNNHESPDVAGEGHSAHQHASTPSLDPASPVSSFIETNTSSVPQEGHHVHVMTGPAANIQKEHAWFAIVGLCVAFFKFLHEVVRPAGRVPQSLWAGTVIFLGILLLLYTE